VQLKLFNLIAAVEPGSWERHRALNLVRSVVPSARLFSELQSLLLFKVDNPYVAVRRLAGKLVGADEPILRLIPVDTVTPPYPDDVAEAAARLVSLRARDGDTFAVRIEGHLFDRETGRRLHKVEAVQVIAEKISLPVNLSEPKLLVLVKVVRISRGLHYAALTVAPPCAIYSRAKNPLPCMPEFREEPEAP
jgi:tRNA acetyltransferase TAN1